MRNQQKLETPEGNSPVVERVLSMLEVLGLIPRNSIKKERKELVQGF